LLVYTRLSFRGDWLRRTH